MVTVKSIVSNRTISINNAGNNVVTITISGPDDNTITPITISATAWDELAKRMK